ncbi:Uncharacterised protein [Mycobacteroides abscessus subsp. abscessus]|nr:Uncharacterised protein [Mycobacteroides abscessus subsp. abscessus]
MREQPKHPVLGEVLTVVGVRIERSLEIVVSHRSTHGHTRIDTTTGQKIDRGEVFGEAERILESERYHRRTEFDPRRPHRCSREHRDRRRDTVLQMPVAQPHAVEAELFGRLYRAKRLEVPLPRVGFVEPTNGEEPHLL